MTLEDFFTSAELKDGLTTPTRVNELITFMQNEKEDIIKNVRDVTHQRSVVATTIAATENKVCFDLFIQLDGLLFIDKWLKDAQKLIYDAENNFLEELIISLLRVLERLQVDHHPSVDSGIGVTVRGLVGHCNLVVQEKAKDLCDKWDHVQNNDGDDGNGDQTVVTSSFGGNNVENVEQLVCSDIVQEETNKEEIPTREIIMVENNKSKLESLTSDVDHGLESATRTETMEDVIDKEEQMVDGGESKSPEIGNPASDIGDSGGGPGGDVGEESHDVDNAITTSDTDNDDDNKKDVEIESENDSGARFTTRSAKSQDDDLIKKRPTDMELDYGMVDPLELARQVANEVELEVNSHEQSCSTSTDEKELGKEVSSRPLPGHGFGPLPGHGFGPEPGISPKGSGSPCSNRLVEPDIPIVTQINETDQESGQNPEKGFSGFDLNQEVSFDEIEIKVNHSVDPILTPISVVSVSRAAAADGLPVTPLQFEGSLSWKGSAMTSAFRRIPEGEKAYSSSSSHNNSNQRLNHFDFDLNVAETNDDKIHDFLSRDKLKESSRLALDLNTLVDVDTAVTYLDWKRDGRASSSMQSYKNSDLNLDDASFNAPFLGKQVNNERDESVISIFGTQVEVNRKDYNNPHPHSSNGKIQEPSIDFTLGRPGSGFGLGSAIPYANLPAYGYGHNGYSMAPIYGPPGAPVPYMVDSRGAPIISNIPPIAPILPAFSPPTQPFFYNMGATGAPSGSNGAGPSRSSVDFNPGFIPEMGNRENNHNMGLRQFFNHNQASSSSVIGGKREEPDSGWEFFPVNYKHQQPPWQ